MGFGPAQGEAVGALTNGSAFVQSNATIAGTNLTGTIASNGMSLSVGNYITTAMASNRASDFVAASAAFAGTNASGTIASNGISVSVAAGGGAATISKYAPYVGTIGTYSSDAPASFYMQQIILPTPVAFSNVVMAKSFDVGVPGATGQASTGTILYSYAEKLSIFTRNGYAANSSQMSYLTSGSWGITANLSYSSTSQSFVMSWVTDSTGGTTSYNTTSNAGNWSSVVTGVKLHAIPLVTTLSAGEYFFAFQHSSSTATTNSNVTLMSVSRQMADDAQQGPGGAFQTNGILSLVVYVGRNGGGNGKASALTTNNTMAISIVTGAASIGRPFFLINNANGAGV